MRKIHRVLAGAVLAAGLSVTAIAPAGAAPAAQAAAAAPAAPERDTVAVQSYDDLDPLIGEYFSCVGAVGATGPWVCVAASVAATNASSAAQELFPDTLHNGTGDAFRHCYWNALMTIDFGAVRAEKVATNHENFVAGPANERSMDLANNAQGRQVGISFPTKATSRQRCSALASNGQLVTLS